MNPDDIIHCDIKKNNLRKKESNARSNVGSQNNNNADTSWNQSINEACLVLRDYSDIASTENQHSNDDIEACNDNETEDPSEAENLKESTFVIVDHEDGSRRTVLKSSMVWILNETKEVLSNDRLKSQKRSNDKADDTQF